MKAEHDVHFLNEYKSHNVYSKFAWETSKTKLPKKETITTTKIWI